MFESSNNRNNVIGRPINDPYFYFKNSMTDTLHKVIKAGLIKNFNEFEHWCILALTYFYMPEVCDNISLFNELIADCFGTIKHCFKLFFTDKNYNDFIKSIQPLAQKASVGIIEDIKKQCELNRIKEEQERAEMIKKNEEEMLERERQEELRIKNLMQCHKEFKEMVKNEYDAIKLKFQKGEFNVVEERSKIYHTIPYSREMLDKIIFTDDIIIKDVYSNNDNCGICMINVCNDALICCGKIICVDCIYKILSDLTDNNEDCPCDDADNVNQCVCGEIKLKCPFCRYHFCHIE